ncbi:mitochondrial carrier [Pholiota conissans]|uniref:Mitochondrial carrier n=1 Tax=Pholiota conissans TaxID=109636 RepID=A0A9P6D0D6_9AGAR|nr:mitochondrial carrier [Pholiota conissans]
METPPDTLLQESHANADSIALRSIKEIAYGSAAGMVSKVFEHPFDLTKVRLQSQVLDETARFNGPIDCLVQTWKKEGIRGLYRGLPAPIAGAMAENASLFLAYAEFKNIIRLATNRTPEDKLPLHNLALAAAGAGCVTSFILTPIELVKCKMQVQMLAPQAAGSSVRTLPGPISVLMSVIRMNGLRGLWLGQTGTLIRETGGTAAWFSTKEYVASLLIAHRLGSDYESLPASARELRPWESAIAGATAGAAFNLALFPADTVKSTMQTAEELRPTVAGAPAQAKPTFGGTFMALYRAQGIRGLYAGCGITVARSIPSSAMIFLIYDELQKYFG